MIKHQWWPNRRIAIMMVKKLVLALFTTLAIQLYGVGFVAETLVKTRDGYKTIQDINAGDLVTCYDFKGSCVERPVIKVIKTYTDTHVELLISGEKISVAPDHKFYLPDKNAWLEAKDLTAGHVLLSNCTNLVTIDEVQFVLSSQLVYDLTVADYHNFCVSTHDIHVHNFFPAIVLTVGYAFGAGGGGGLFINVAGPLALGALFYYSTHSNRGREYDYSPSENTQSSTRINKEGNEFSSGCGGKAEQQPASAGCFTEREKPTNVYSQPLGEKKPCTAFGCGSTQDIRDSTIFHKGVKDKEDNLPINKGDVPFVPKKNKDGKIPRDKEGGFMDNHGRSWRWDPKKNEWDVQQGKGHINVNKYGKITH
jgi:hypothetical protein